MLRLDFWNLCNFQFSGMLKDNFILCKFSFVSRTRIVNNLQHCFMLFWQNQISFSPFAARRELVEEKKNLEQKQVFSRINLCHRRKATLKNFFYVFFLPFHCKQKLWRNRIVFAWMWWWGFIDSPVKIIGPWFCGFGVSGAGAGAPFGFFERWTRGAASSGAQFHLSRSLSLADPAAATASTPGTPVVDLAVPRWTWIAKSHERSRRRAKRNVRKALQTRCLSTSRGACEITTGLQKKRLWNTAPSRFYSYS